MGATQVAALAGDLGSSSKWIRAGQVGGNKQLISKVLGQCADQIRKIKQLNFVGVKNQTNNLSFIRPVSHSSSLIAKQKAEDFIYF